MNNDARCIRPRNFLANMPLLPLLKLSSIFSHYVLTHPILLWEILIIILCLRPWIISSSMLLAGLDGMKYWTTVIAQSGELIIPLWCLLWVCQTATPHIWSLVTKTFEHILWSDILHTVYDVLDPLRFAYRATRGVDDPTVTLLNLFKLK